MLEYKWTEQQKGRITMMPLSMVPYGQEKKIIKISGRDQTQKHLANLGLVAGESVMVISELGGNLILKEKETRLALDKAMVNRIQV